MSADEARGRRRLASVSIDDASIDRGSPDQEHERAIAIYDLVEENSFAVPDRDDGPYELRIGLQDARLAFDIRTQGGESVLAFGLSLTPLRSILRDYFLVCENYYAAIRTASAAQIEAIDRSRGALHDEGAELVAQRLADKVDVDAATARRLFTLICALHWKA
ncbi:MAG: UPF0262 family protein [Roseiarcus sp.]|jgi:uncharacterized protein (UPF0262 family)